jgi:6-phosphogluconolactonase (cycloisomerase 2 family)
MISRLRLHLALLSALLGLLPATAESAAPSLLDGAVYTMTNGTGGNAVLAFWRASDGTLSIPVAYPTGGFGTGSNLGNQGGLALSKNGRRLFVVNTGSAEITSFEVTPNRLKNPSNVTSGGLQPISVATHGNLVYVLNAGSDAIAGFKVNSNGRLKPLANSNRSLSGTGVRPAQIGFSPDGRNLVITEKATNRIVIFRLKENGLPKSNPTVIPSPAPTPCGFDFAGKRFLLVSEAANGAAGAGSVSSFRVAQNGAVWSLNAAVPTLQTATCWLKARPNGKQAYATNAGSQTLTGYQVSSQGSIKLLNGDGASATLEPGSNPTDLAFSRNGRFLYTVNDGNHSISSFRVGDNGSLRLIANTAGLPPAVVNIASR